MIELKTLPDNYELPEYFENRTKGFGDLIRDLHRWHNKEECLLDVISHAEFLLRKLKDKSSTHHPRKKVRVKNSVCININRDKQKLINSGLCSLFRWTKSAR